MRLLLGFLEQLREIRRALDEAGLERILNETLDRGARDLGAENNPSPRLRDEIRRHVALGFVEQFRARKFLSLLRILDHPIRQFGVGLSEFLGEIAVIGEKLYARNQDRGRDIFFLHQNFAAGFTLKARDPWLNCPDRIDPLLLEKRE